MGFWGSVCSVVSSVVSSAVSVVSSAVKEIGSVVVETASKFLDMTIEKLEKVVDILEKIAKVLGIIKPEEDTEDIGDRAMRADKKPEDFDSTNDYIEYLRENIRAASKEELEARPLEERLARKAVGSALLSKAIGEKKSLEIPIEFWKETVSLGLDAKEIDTFLTKFQNAGIAPSEFLKYLKRELDLKEESKIDSALVDAYKELEPEADIKEIEEKVVRMQGN
jgi:hypothetical protein